jgi:hypothetical protein
MPGRVFAVRSTIARSLDPVGAVVAGFVTAEIAVPATADSGAWTPVIRRVVVTRTAVRHSCCLCTGIGLATARGLIGTAVPPPV